MKNVTAHHGTLRILRRLPSSKNGNPRFLVLVDQGAFTGWQCRTAPDSSLAYALSNYEGKRVVATIGTHYGVTTLDSIKLAGEA